MKIKFLIERKNETQNTLCSKISKLNNHQFVKLPLNIIFITEPVTLTVITLTVIALTAKCPSQVKLEPILQKKLILNPKAEIGVQFLTWNLLPSNTRSV